jgi:hypothetical protein
MTNDQIQFDLKDCVKNKGILYISVPELIKLFERFPYHLGKDFKELLNKANVSDKIQEINDGQQK